MAAAGPVRALALASGFGACTPEPMPTERAVARAEAEERAAQADVGGGGAAEDGGSGAAEEAEVVPPLYQLLYDAPLVGPPDPELERVRLLAWLRDIHLDADQLRLLDELRRASRERLERIRRAEEEHVARTRERRRAVYARIWDALRRDATEEELRALARELAEVEQGGEPEAELMRMRMEEMRSLLDLEQPFLKSLRPEQEAALSRGIFALRSVLDPVAQPRDFLELVGTTYEVGQYDVLVRGTGADAFDEQVGIGGLWTDDPDDPRDPLYNARREVILYLLLLQPGLDEAIAAERERRAASGG